jgi:hypothetical protein
VQEGWNDKSRNGCWAPTAKAIKARARDAKRAIGERVTEMQKQGEDLPQVMLVSHNAFLHDFTEDWEDYIEEAFKVSVTIYLVTQRITQHGI